jgi:phage repressor protein C with HTH and peptisase S24 domain
MSTQGKRFAEVRKNILKMSQQALAKYCNVPQSVISSIETDTLQRIDPAILRKIAEKFNIDISYIIIGKSDKTKNCNNNAIAVPFYNAPVAAGKGEEIIESPSIDSIYFDKRWLENVLCVNPGKLFLVYAKGDSMDSGFHLPNDIHDGDLLLVDSSTLDGNGKTFVILVNNQELRVKRLFKKLDGTLIISSSNNKYKEEKYIPNETNEIEIKVLGRVVWNGSKENI